MHKKLPTKLKLSLHKETIRALVPDQLHRVAGGQLPDGTGWTSLNGKSCLTCNCAVSQNGCSTAAGADREPRQAGLLRALHEVDDAAVLRRPCRP